MFIKNAGGNTKKSTELINQLEDFIKLFKEIAAKPYKCASEMLKSIDVKIRYKEFIDIKL